MMQAATTVILVVCLYMGLLLALALWVEKRAGTGAKYIGHPLVYVLALGVYCTTWTYYGSIGSAATTGWLFITVYAGPILMLLLFPMVLRKLVRIRNENRITSIADFLGSRYGKSQAVAAMATIIALVGTTPYVALQLKAVIATFGILTGTPDASSFIGVMLVFAMVVFTIAFGVRRLDPTERHQAMVVTVAALSAVKLVLLVTAGAYVVYFLHNGFGELLLPVFRGHISPVKFPPPGKITWMTWLVLSMSAVLFLPRQFHVAVVENVDETHIRAAVRHFPAYLVLMTLFAYPVAVAGRLAGIPISQADFYILHLPLAHGHFAIALLVFVGGFSAAAGMIMVSAMTVSTMTANHLLLPVFSRVRKLAPLQRHLLKCRWGVVALYIFTSYWFERQVGDSFILVNIGMISFAAMFQFAPAILFGLFWKRASRKGALAGLAAGFLVWTYTSLLPSFIKSGWLPLDWLSGGPFAIGWLNPEQLFGWRGLDPLSHALAWSLLVNAGFLIAGSLLFKPAREDTSQAEAFVGVLHNRMLLDPFTHRKAYIDLESKAVHITRLFSRYFEDGRAAAMCRQCIEAAGLSGRQQISIVELAGLCGRVETLLAGSIGSGAARQALEKARLFSPTEARDLSDLYGEILANLRASPEDLWRKIDFYQERQALIAQHAEQLKEKVRELEAEIAKRQTAESHLRESEERYRTAIEYSNDGVTITREDRLIFVNRKFAEIFGYDSPEDLTGKSAGIIIHPDDRPRISEMNLDIQRGKAPSRYDFKGLKKDGTPIYIAVSSARITYMGRDHSLIFIRDVTARRQAEEEVRHLSRRLIDGIEEERKRLATDLHDELGQALTGLHLGLGALQNSLPDEMEAQRRRCADMIFLAEGLAESIRKISTDLRPSMLDDLGLVPTLKWHIEEFRNRIPGIEIDFEAMGIRERLPAPIEILVYRIAQEALTNIAKHSRASRVDIRLTYSYPQLVFFVNDNGVGFQPAEAPAGRIRRGIGILGMRERVAAAGGKIDIRSAPGAGAQIRVSVPVGHTQVPGEPQDE